MDSPLPPSQNLGVATPNHPGLMPRGGLQVNVYRISPSTSRFKNKSKSNFWGGKCVQNRRFKYKSNQKFGKNKRPKRREIPSQRSLYSRKFGPAIYNFA